MVRNGVGSRFRATINHMESGVAEAMGALDLTTFPGMNGARGLRPAEVDSQNRMAPSDISAFRAARIQVDHRAEKW